MYEVDEDRGHQEHSDYPSDFKTQINQGNGFIIELLLEVVSKEE